MYSSHCEAKFEELGQVVGGLRDEGVLILLKTTQGADPGSARIWKNKMQ